MINIGDRVTHKVFPPIDGVVTGIQPMVNNEPRISVKRDDTGSIIWGMQSEWEVINNTEGDDEDIIDVEYTVIE